MQDQGVTGARRHFVVSHEMTVLIGTGDATDAAFPPSAMSIAFDVETETPNLTFDLQADADRMDDGAVTLVIERAAFERLGGSIPDPDVLSYHAPSTLRAIVLAIADARLEGEMLTVYQLGKSIELLCETIRLLNENQLVPVAGDGVLSLEDARRVAFARRMIDERASEKLTLDSIARACGLNRAKLTRGFRSMFNCTIGEALTEKRLHRACEMLATTNMPVATIGYENGYLNNASFSRAFSRRFGVTPSDYRSCPIAA